MGSIGAHLCHLPLSHAPGQLLLLGQLRPLSHDLRVLALVLPLANLSDAGTRTGKRWHRRHLRGQNVLALVWRLVCGAFLPGRVLQLPWPVGKQARSTSQQPSVEHVLPGLHTSIASWSRFRRRWRCFSRWRSRNLMAPVSTSTGVKSICISTPTSRRETLTSRYCACAQGTTHLDSAELGHARQLDERKRSGHGTNVKRRVPENEAALVLLVPAVAKTLVSACSVACQEWRCTGAGAVRTRE